MNKYFAYVTIMLCIGARVHAAVDAYGFYLYGFQGSDASDVSMKQILAASWDQLPETTPQQKDLKDRLATKFEKKFNGSVATVIAQLPRLSDLQQSCDATKTSLSSDHATCQGLLKDCRSATTTLNANLGDIKDIKDKLEKGLTAIKGAEERFKQSKAEETDAFNKYTELLYAQDGAALLPKAVERIKLAYQQHDDAIKALQQACAEIGVPITLEVNQEHIMVEGLIALNL